MCSKFNLDIVTGNNDILEFGKRAIIYGTH